MTTLDIKRLQSMSGYPCISIIVPTHRTMPQRQQDPILIKNLVGQALEKLTREFNVKQIEPLAVAIDKLIASIDYAHLLDGLAIFVNKDIAEAHMLPFHVRESVIVDDAFNLREILFAESRSPQTFVLVLNHKPTRLFKAHDNTLLEIIDPQEMRDQQKGFPFEWQWDITSDRVKQAELNGEKDAAFLTAKKREFFQEVDKALDQHINANNTPIILMGNTDNCGEYMRVTKHSNRIVVQGNGEFSNAPVELIAKEAAPLIQAYVQATQDALLKKITEAAGKEKFAAGIKEVWKAAHEGRVDKLIVEDNYKECGYTNQAAPEELVINVDPKEPAVSDDLVDRLIDLVLEKGGTVIFVKPDALKQHQHVVAFLRF